MYKYILSRPVPEVQFMNPPIQLIWPWNCLHPHVGSCFLSDDETIFLPRLFFRVTLTKKKKVLLMNFHCSPYRWYPRKMNNDWPNKSHMRGPPPPCQSPVFRRHPLSLIVTPLPQQRARLSLSSHLILSFPRNTPSLSLIHFSVLSRLSRTLISKHKTSWRRSQCKIYLHCKCAL